MPEIEAMGHPDATEFITLCRHAELFELRRLADRGWTVSGELAFKYHEEKHEAVLELRECLHELLDAEDVVLVDPCLASDIRQSFRIYA